MGPKMLCKVDLMLQSKLDVKYHQKFQRKNSDSEKFQFWQIPILTNFNSDKFQFWQIPILKKYKFWQNPILTNSNSDKFHFWQIPILTNSNSDKFQFWQIPILTNSNSDKFQFLRKSGKKWVRTNTNSDKFRSPITSCADQCQIFLRAYGLTLSKRKKVEPSGPNLGPGKRWKYRTSVDPTGAHVQSSAPMSESSFPRHARTENLASYVWHHQLWYPQLPPPQQLQQLHPQPQQQLQQPIRVQ